MNSSQLWQPLRLWCRACKVSSALASTRPSAQSITFSLYSIKHPGRAWSEQQNYSPPPPNSQFNGALTTRGATRTMGADAKPPQKSYGETGSGGARDSCRHVSADDQIFQLAVVSQAPERSMPAPRSRYAWRENGTSRGARQRPGAFTSGRVWESHLRLDVPRAPRDATWIIDRQTSTGMSSLKVLWMWLPQGTLNKPWLHVLSTERLA